MSVTYDSPSNNLFYQCQLIKAKVASLLNTETINCKLGNDVSENKEIISELKKKKVFQTKIMNELKFKLNKSMNKFEKLETTVFNMASEV